MSRRDLTVFYATDALLLPGLMQGFLGVCQPNRNTAQFRPERFQAALLDIVVGAWRGRSSRRPLSLVPSRRPPLHGVLPVTRCY
jgi:hypothetical protein